MWIMEICAYWIIGILKNLKWIKKSISKFGLNKGCLTTSFNNIIFINGPLVFKIQFISSLIFCSNRVLLDTFKKTLVIQCLNQIQWVCHLHAIMNSKNMLQTWCVFQKIVYQFYALQWCTKVRYIIHSSNFQWIPRHVFTYNLKPWFVYLTKTPKHGRHHGQVWQ
jgi:hypothetical protein